LFSFGITILCLITVGYFIVQMISKNNNNKKRSNAAMNASQNEKKANKILKQTVRDVEQLSLFELAKTKNSKRGTKRRMNAQRDQSDSYNGGRIDRFPRGNKQGMGFGNKNSIIVEESEYIAEVTSNSTTFSLLSTYPINPGQASTFPWLSTIAKNYEKYEFLALQWIYKPEVSQYASNGQTGKVLLSVDYDASDAPPSTKAQMEDVVPHSDAMPYQQLKLNCRPKEMHANSDAKFIRPGNLPSNTDIKTYDAGNLFVGISGIANNSGTLGELHVKYIVKLSIPILEGSTGQGTNLSITEYIDATPQAYSTTVTAVDPMATLVGINGLNVVNTAGVFTIPSGNYLVLWSAVYKNAGADGQNVVANLLLNGATTVSTGNSGNGATGSTVSGFYFWRSDSTSATSLRLSITTTSAGSTDSITGSFIVTSI
jgi:hypothetical protein